MSFLTFILGREPHLSVAEIVAVFPDAEWAKAELSKEALVASGDVGAALRGRPRAGMEPRPYVHELIKRLGGTVKIGEVWRRIPNDEFLISNAETIGKFILDQTSADRKVHFGYSVYDLGGGAARVREVRESLRRGAAAQKAWLTERERKVRWVTSREPTLSSVIVAKNDLLPERNGVEVLVLVGAEHIILARTLAVQPFEEWSQRDYGRPSRDARSGMLPPKLARAMLNIALAPVSSDGFGIEARIGGVGRFRPDDNDTDQRYEQRHRQRSTTPFTLLDPFCGSGTILTEAMALGIPRIIGTDVSVEAVKDTKANVTWTQGRRSFSPSREGEREGEESISVHVQQCDVRQLSQCVRERVDAIVTEPFLGPPRGLRSIPTSSPSLRGGVRGGDAFSARVEREGERFLLELRTLYIAAFREFAKVFRPGGRAVFIVPVFRQNHSLIRTNRRIVRTGTHHVGEQEIVLEITRKVEQLGFRRLDLFPAPLRDHPVLRGKADLPYARSDQRVGRRILVFEFRITSPRTVRLSRKSRS